MPYLRLPSLTVAELADQLRPGTSVYLPGSAGEPTPLLDLWRAEPDRTRGLRILHSLVPGINTLDVDALDLSAVATGIFMQPGWHRAQVDGQVRHLPVSYSGFVRFVSEMAPVDCCVVHVAPPDDAGRCSLGPAVEFTPLVQARSRRIVALVNPAMPAMPGAAFLPMEAFDAVVDVGHAPKGYVVGRPDATASAIASGIAAFIDDGCTVQVGLGKVPDALMGQLGDRRRLRLHSGMLSDSALALMRAGAVEGVPVSCVWVGSSVLYGELRDTSAVVTSCDQTHDAGVLARLPRMRAVNSALSVDLLGQANLEVAGGRTVSGLGGAADFARGARTAPGGLSIVALPATHARGTESRIVVQLDGAVASLGRTDVDVVVTEHGAADLRGRSVAERAAALIAVAAPAHRAALSEGWAAAFRSERTLS